MVPLVHGKLLLMDDDNVIIVVTGKLLKEIGYDVIMETDDCVSKGLHISRLLSRQHEKKGFFRVINVDDNWGFRMSDLMAVK